MLKEDQNITLLGPEFFGSHEERLAESVRHILDPDSWSNLKEQVALDKSFKYFLSLYTKENTSNYNLFGGLFYQISANYFQETEKNTQLLKLSYRHYGDFQKNKSSNKDINYFVQWQRGVLEDNLGVDWIQVEKTLTDASEYYPARGEALRHIIEHYRIAKQEGLGYIFSSVAKDMFYGNIPQESVWFTNHSFYNWKVLYYHAEICRKLRDREEEKRTVAQLKVCLDQHPEYFTEEDRKRLSHIK